MKAVKHQIARTYSTPNTGASFQLSDEYGIVEVQVVEMTEAAATKQASVTTLHVSLSIFTKIKLLILNRDSSMVFYVIVLLL